jgi:hypothetical protein
VLDAVAEVTEEDPEPTLELFATHSLDLRHAGAPEAALLPEERERAKR